MNSYDATPYVKALDEIAGSMPDTTDISSPLEDIYNALNGIADALGRIVDVMEADQADRKEREEAEEHVPRMAIIGPAFIPPF